MNKTGMNRGQILKGLRQEAGLTQKWVAEAIYGKPNWQAKVAHFETGRQLMNENEIIEFAKLFNVDKSVFFRAPEGGTDVTDIANAYRKDGRWYPKNTDNMDAVAKSRNVINGILLDEVERENKALQEEVKALKAKIEELEKARKTSLEMSHKTLMELGKYKEAFSELAMKHLEIGQGWETK